MSKIEKRDTNGVKPLLAVGEFGYDNYPEGGDIGRVYVGNGSENIPQAKKAEVVAVDGKVNTHVARIDNPHGVTKTQVGLSNVDNTADSAKVVASAGKWTTARTLSLTGGITGSVSIDGSGNASIVTTVAANSVALGTDTTGNYVAGTTAGAGVTVSGTPGEGWSPTIALTDVGTVGTYTKVTTNSKGQITVGGTLVANDIPNLDTSKITTGTLPVGIGGTGTTTSTGTGAVVLSTSPVLVTPTIGVATGTSFNSITGLSSTTPVMDGTATAGTGFTVARADHVHPKDTTKVDANANITAGTYKSVTVDVKGLVTGGTNPTTIGGYGITDAYTKTELDGVNIGRGTQSFNGFGGSGFKNYIINGNFDVWQYGTSQTNNGCSSADRWCNNNSVSTKTYSQIACTDTERALFNASKFSRTVVSSVTGVSNYITTAQRIEDVTKLAGKTITVSFWAKADSNKNIWLEFKQIFGTGGSPSVLVNGIYGQAVGLTTTWQKKTITLTLPSIIGKTVGANGVHTSYTELQFWFDVGSDFTGRIPTGIQQSGTFDIAQVQLEEGSVATPFENRPYGLELSLCQRYYKTGTSMFGARSTGDVVIGRVEFDIQMRVPPTVTTTIVNGGVPTIGFVTSSGFDWYATPTDMVAKINYTAVSEL